MNIEQVTINKAQLLRADIDDTVFIETLAALPYVDSILLFGSRATETFSPFSDMDIAIDCPKASASQWHEITEIVERAYTLLKIDVVRYDTLKEGFFKRQIDDKHVILYAKRHG